MFIPFLLKRGAKIEVILFTAKPFHVKKERNFHYPLLCYIFLYFYPLFHYNMFKRTIHDRLTEWASDAGSPPLLIRGGRQTGKSFLLKSLTARFSQSLYYNMEAESDRRIFASASTPAELEDALFFFRDKAGADRKALVFADNLEQCPPAAKQLMELHNSGSALRVAATTRRAAGPLNGEAGEAGWEVHALSPLSFGEFLPATGDLNSVSAFAEVPVPTSAHEKLLRHFHLYTLIGGMPGIAERYSRERHLAGLRHVYEEILASVTREAGQLAGNRKRAGLLDFVIQNAFPYAATRIRFRGFCNATVRSREMGEAFRSLEKILFLELVYPCTSTTSDAQPDRNKSPRLHLMDTGLVNYFSGIQKTLYQAADMNAIFRGQVARQVVGQEILAGGTAGALHFWVRDKAQSTAEVDFLIPFGDMMIPVLVRSGEPGRLRSLHQFVDQAPHPYAVRLHAGHLSISEAMTLGGKKFFLMSLPYYLAGKVSAHLEGFIRYVNAATPKHGT
jgi:predicted AAA+ superfamily ATPase